MNDDLPLVSEPRIVKPPPAGELPEPPPAAAQAGAEMPARGAAWWRWPIWFVVLSGVLAIGALYVAWSANQRVRSNERELVKRQQDSTERVAEANMLAHQAQEATREATAKVALLEARINEVSVQRSQLEDLIQSVARSRDESLLADIESSLRAAMQQSSLTGSAEPLTAALRQSDERLARADQPRLEPLRRAIAHDLERVRLTTVADVATLTIRLDEATRLVDELPLVSAAEPRRGAGAEGSFAVPQRADAAARSAGPGAASGAASAPGGGWFGTQLDRAGRFLGDNVWREVRALVRVTRIDHPEAMLIAPDQAFFLRENLKLRLLNARLALLARQGDAAQGDLKLAQQSIERYFDPDARRTKAVLDLLHQVAAQAGQVGAARPDDTFAALAALGARR